MNIPLVHFEQIIDEAILKRGLDYFRKGFVDEPDEISTGCYEAIVQGSEPYRVSVTISDEKAILQSAKGRGGFIEWGRTAAVGRAVMGFLEGAKQNLRSGNYHSAILISIAVLEEMVKAIQYSDDSDGDIGGCADEAMEVLYQVSKSELPEEQRKFLLEYAVAAFKKGLFEGWDWHLGIISLAVELIREPDDTDKLINILESAPHSEYEHERFQELILAVLRKR